MNDRFLSIEKIDPGALRILISKELLQRSKYSYCNLRCVEFNCGINISTFHVINTSPELLMFLIVAIGPVHLVE